MSSKVYAYGKNPLKEALLAVERGATGLIETIYITKDAQEDREVMSLLQKHGQKYSISTEDEIKSMVGWQSLHQGIAFSLNEKDLYTSLDEAIARAEKKEKNAIFVL